MASPELQSKLQRRLFLNREATTPTASSAATTLCTAAQAVATAAWGWRSADEMALRERINVAALECSEARQQKQSIEATAVSQGIELGAEVARLRVDVEVLRRDLEAAQNEVLRLRAGCSLEDRRERVIQERACRADIELATAEARREALAREVQISSEERAALESQVQCLEDEVQQHVIGRVRLEALLRASEVREAELRRLRDAAEVSVQRARDASASARAVAARFSLDLDDEDSAEDLGGPPSAKFLRKSVDLEFSYEGLELGSLMSLDRALQLARQGSGKAQGGDFSRGSSAEAGPNGGSRGSVAGSGGAQWPSTLAEESLYEAPLRELELALARMQGNGEAGLGDGGAGGGNASAGSSPGIIAAPGRRAGSGGADEGFEATMGAASAGTGEAADAGAYEAQVIHLQEALIRLRRAAVAAASGEASDRGGSGGGTRGAASEVAPLPAPPAQSPPAALTAETAAPDVAAAVSAPALPLVAAAREDAEASAAATFGADTKEEGPVSPAPEEVNGADAQRPGPPSPLGLGSFFASPYARISQKYSAFGRSTS